MAGINELKEVVAFGVSLGNALGKALEDGKITLTDAGLVVDPLLKAVPAFNGLEQVPAELADLTDEEKAELLQFVSEAFDIPQEKTEALVERGLKIAVDVIGFISALKA